MQLELELGSGFEEGFVHGIKSGHLGYLLYARQVLRLGGVDQQDSKSETHVDNRSHKREVKEKSDHCAFLQSPFKNVNHKLTNLEDERDKHEDEDSEGPSDVAMLPKLEKEEEVGCDIGSCHQRVSNDVDNALVESFTHSLQLGVWKQ